MRNRLSNEEGFTLIELLVVILIIGILAAIALPNFLGQRARGQDAAAKSNARNMVSQVEACYSDGQVGGYGVCKDADLGANTGLEFGKLGGQVTVEASTDNSYTILATSISKNEFRIAKDATGKITRTCAVKGSDKGGCAAVNW